MPADYESLSALAADYWEYFEEGCRKYSRFGGNYPQEFEEWLYERSIHCDEEDPGTVNQFDPDSGGEDGDL